MEWFYRSKPLDEEGKAIKGCQKRMFTEWRDREMLESTDQRVCDLVRVIRNNSWLSEIKFKAIKIQVEYESQGELCREQHVTVDLETIETDFRTVKEGINDPEDNIYENKGDLSEEP